MEASALRSVRFCASSEDPAPVKRITRPTRFHPRRVRCGSRNRGANQRCRDDWQGTGGTGGTPAIPCRWCLTRLTPGPSSRLAERAPGARVWLKHWRSRYGARGTRTPDLLAAMRSRASRAAFRSRKSGLRGGFDGACCARTGGRIPQVLDATLDPGASQVVREVRLPRTLKVYAHLFDADAMPSGASP
jgi:hypothetical protein